jgi:predicted phosphodiesterase
MSKIKLEKILFIPDCHVPYQDKPAFKLMLKAGKAFKPQHTVILGDFADFYGVSSHSKDPNRALKLERKTTFSCPVITKTA